MGVVCGLGVAVLLEWKVRVELMNLETNEEKAAVEVARLGEWVDQVADFKRNKTLLDQLIVIANDLDRPDARPELLQVVVNLIPGGIDLERVFWSHERATIRVRSDSPERVVELAQRVEKSVEFSRVAIKVVAFNHGWTVYHLETKLETEAL